MEIDLQTLLYITTIDQLIEIMKTNKELKKDTILQVMEKLNPRTLDIELRKFYLYSCCMSNRSDLIKKYATSNLEPSYYFGCFTVYLDTGPKETARTILELMKTYTDYPIKDLALEMMLARSDLIIEVVKFLKQDEIKQNNINKRDLKNKLKELADEMSDTDSEISYGFNDYDDDVMSWDSLDGSDYN
ncbi:MAG: hypothetical protein CMF62_03560 [Magnetococcales bacterium]|nr:hypothetical protein [Magnetococcales bacterium]|tara:strand:- start:40561 stop:41124 length:564 start_codon:yes stop_codon:yes gene_type:complete